ncbi:MAG: DEAD/DEAH box helicase, partial [Planctomycetota bacterium]
NADKDLTALVDELCAGRAVPEGARGPAEDKTRAEPLTAWVRKVLCERLLPTGPVADWSRFERRDPAFARTARVFLEVREGSLPAGVPPVEPGPQGAAPDSMDVLVPVLDRYVRHRLRRSESKVDHQLARKVTRRLRMLGAQITETGCQACASPVSRVLGYTRAKAAALVPILTAERATLGERIRAVVITDYERTSAVEPEVAHLLDAEAGGAVAAFRTLLSDPGTDALDPVLVTGSTVLVDDDLSSRLMDEAKSWLSGRGLDIELGYDEEAGFNILFGRGGQWRPRVYVEMITELFQRGVTKCLVGTRGLLGEGWDASKVNVLLDLTTATTSMTTNQLRGRSIRLDPDDPQKLADNWDVVCIAPEFRKGLDDYHDFTRKHRSLYGVTDDGAIEKGVGHVHAAFTELEPEGVTEVVGPLNEDMLDRASRREHFRRLWRVGEPYHAAPIRAAEVRHAGGGGGGFPPFAGADGPWSDRELALAIGKAVFLALREAGLVRSGKHVAGGERAGGVVRLFLKDASEKDMALFTESLGEALGPLDRPRYVIPRKVAFIRDTWLSRLLPEFVGRYCRKRKLELAMWHSVPSALSRRKELAAVYQRHWNAQVSPGEAVYAHRGEGELIVAEALREGLAPCAAIREKDIFM